MRRNLIGNKNPNSNNFLRVIVTPIFFHSTTTCRKNKNYIFSLQIDAVTVYEPSILRKHVNDFYKNLLGQSTDKYISLSPSFWSIEDQLTDQQQNQLDLPFTIDEIKKVIFLCIASKAPCPDGFSFFLSILVRYYLS
jgi:hypothetical protein